MWLSDHDQPQLGFDSFLSTLSVLLLIYMRRFQLSLHGGFQQLMGFSKKNTNEIEGDNTKFWVYVSSSLLSPHPCQYLQCSYLNSA